MLFDWFTTIAQVINFIILLVVLKYLLYNRVLEAIDRRRREIEERQQDAKDARGEALAEAEHYREQREEIERKREDLIKRAQREADERRTELLGEARSEIEQRRERWLSSLEDEKDRLVERISTQVGRSVLDVSEHVLAELADEELQQATIAGFIRYLRGLDDDERNRLSGALEDGQVVISSAFELDDETKEQLSAAVGEHIDAKVERFETDEELLAGIRLAAGGRSVGWSMRDHLEELVAGLNGDLSEQAGGR